MRQPPKKTTGQELGHAVVRGAVGAIPVLGSPLAESFTTAIDWKYNKRTAEWMADLAVAVTELQDNDLSFDDLAESDTFVNAVMNATKAAQSTHQTDKLRALRNGVLNSLDTNAPSDDEQARFFRLVEEFTPAHLKLLGFLHDPGKTFDDAGIQRTESTMGGSRGSLLERAIPEFANQREWYDLLAADIGSAHLASISLHAMMTAGGAWVPATTDLGNRFLAFIADPQA